MSAADPKQPNTKERLATVVSSFDTFDTEMKIGTRQRREKDEFKIAELKAEMTRLDEDLNAEVKRRKEMNKSTQTWFEEQLVRLDTNFHKTLKDVQNPPTPWGRQACEVGLVLFRS